MLELALTTGDRAALMATLRSSHRMRVTVTILDRNEKPLKQLDVPASRIVDGAVEVDALADITRSLRLEFLDEKRALTFDAASPSRSGIFADNLLAVDYGVQVPAVGWIDVPVFWGPITDFERSRSRVTVEAQGKEALGLDPHFVTQGYTLRKGRRVDDAIRDVMDRLGESRYSLPEMPKRLPRARAVQPEDEPWQVVKFGWESTERRLQGKGRDRRRKRVSVDYNGLASLAGPFVVYYNGRGQLTARRRTTNPVLELAEGRDLVTLPTVTFDALTVRNHVVVTGAKVTVGKAPNRRKVQRRAHATLQADHPLSPWALRRGRPGAEIRRFMTEFVEADALKTTSDCRQRAARVLAERSRDGLDVSFECLPMPMLEELDNVRISTADFALDFPLQRWTLPLRPGSPMVVGWTRGARRE